VECFWSFQAASDTTQLVVPDGCMDVLVRCKPVVYTIDVIGSMSCADRVQIHAGESYLGVRFRPGQIKTFFPSLDCGRLVDRFLPLSAFAEDQSGDLAHQLSASMCIEERIMWLERSLHACSDTTTSQSAIDLMVARHGDVNAEELADTAQLSDRQFRRQCFQLTGLSPKTLARVLRFKNACAVLQNKPSINMAELAVDCNFFDQAHMNREFQSMTNLTPLNFARQQTLPMETKS
jgi:AraC-like DNA-binding protein